MEKLNASVDAVRLITGDELKGLGCKVPYCTGAPAYIYSTSYWSSPYSSSSAWRVVAGGKTFGQNPVETKNAYGVRPVIELSKSLFEQ